MANIRPLSNALAKRASIELNEVHSEIPEHIKIVREWLKTQLHLRTPLSKYFQIKWIGTLCDLIILQIVLCVYFFSTHNVLVNCFNINAALTFLNNCYRN